MKGKNFSIGYYEYTNLFQILHSLKSEIERKVLILNGTKQIPPELVAVSLLNDRYLFLYPPEKTYEGYGMRKDFKLEIYQIAALTYTFQNMVELPLGLENFLERLVKTLKPFSYEAVRTKFQIFYETNLMQEYEWSYTELRDEHPHFYDYLFNQSVQKL
jgi:hypothetical protein